MNKKIFVIIVTYNGIKWIDNCLSSIRRSTVPLRTIVIDNHSTDNTVQHITDHYSEVNLLMSNDNLGFGQANNIGIKMAYNDGADYVYLLNQDAWLMPDTIEKLVFVMDNNSDIGILSPIQLDATRKRVDKLFLKDILASNSTVQEVINSFITNEVPQFCFLNFFPAAHWLISRKCLAEVGLFSPAFFHYGEDNNYIQRAHYYGFKTAIAPCTMAIHDRGERKKLDIMGKIFLHYNASIGEASNIEVSTFRHNVSIVKFIIYSTFYYLFIKGFVLFRADVKSHYVKLTSLETVIGYYKMTKNKGFLLKM